MSICEKENCNKVYKRLVYGYGYLCDFHATEAWIIEGNKKEEEMGKKLWKEKFKDQLRKKLKKINYKNTEIVKDEMNYFFAEDELYKIFTPEQAVESSFRAIKDSIEDSLNT